MGEYDDLNLETSFLKNPEASFRSVYLRYSGPLFRFLYRFTANNQASEEILQDIFLELLAGRFKSTEGGTLKAWLFTVAKNRGLNYRKKMVTRKQLQFNDQISPGDLEEQTIAQNLLKNLKSAEERLPQDLKQTWELRKRGLDYQEISEALAIPLGTVKSRFSRLVEVLRKEFGHGT
jgi:RNA polymerase sigma-70 factor (ECF subfamily)